MREMENAQRGRGKRVQTFLPHPDFYESASVLDQIPSGKLRMEVLHGKT
jgi:hypothetical protein